MPQDTELGTLIVVVLKARNLIDRHSFYKQDVFAQATLNGTAKKTPVDIKGGQHPVWDAELRFSVDKAVSEKTRKIEVSCFSKESRSDDLLGRGTVDISETLQTGEFDDWVSLDIDGVVRGDVYLEMTFFSAAPAPAPVAPKPSGASLSVPQSQYLTRRPSKLPPSERLYRPPQSAQSHPKSKSDKYPPGSTTTGQQSIPSHHTPSRSRDSALPPLPGNSHAEQAALPGILKPGPARTPQAQATLSNTGPPTFLRPGNGKSPSPSRLPPEPRPPSVSPPSRSPGHSPQPSASYGPPLYSGSAAPNNPYLAASTPIPPVIPVIPAAGNTVAPPTSYPSYTNTLPPGWDQTAPPSNFSFPMPMMANAPQPSFRQADVYPTYGYQHQQAPSLSSSPPPDTHLAVRYQTPLPLPPGLNGHSEHTAPRGRQSEPKPDLNRLQALKKAEEEAAARREQEQRDLELALQLDRQLNT
ncbi:hypothetical protein NP233_g3008 [Leucocoprinus birnbaumii]|uniref:C2 domain-containing protein n=1 Tax=Leucocoprinus birnbaumii TaxID=56174 RepID=A0AAD5YYA0_9AGAR|nr:hypothetical protein NP233_g3008 [Leucocoprinus birnbaumii]